MIDPIKAWILRAARVPSEPRLPAGNPRSARVFRAGLNYWRLKRLGWGVKQAVTLAGFLVMVAVLQWIPETVQVKRKNRPARVVNLSAIMVGARAVEVMSLGLWLVQVPFTFALARLDYEMRWYIVTDRAARLREGILGVREMTLSLANVQDIRLRRGPLQRALGLADVELRTAGGGEPAPDSHETENLHLARFRCVDAEVAEAIRDLVQERMRGARGAGLGDPDDTPAVVETPDGHPALADAAAELRRESTALRAAAERLAR